MNTFRRAQQHGAHMGTRTRRSGGWRVAIAGGALLGAGTLATWATFSDAAMLNLGSDGEGIGSSSLFDIALVDSAGTVKQADADGGLAWELDNAASFVPGRTLTTEIPVFNNSKTYDGALSLTLDTVGDGAVGASPNITRFILFSAVDTESGEVLFGDPADPARGVALAAAQARIGDLSARGDDSLEEGDSYVAGADGSERTIEVLLHYTDVPETAEFNGGQAAIRVLFDAESK